MWHGELSWPWASVTGQTNTHRSWCVYGCVPTSYMVNASIHVTWYKSSWIQHRNSTCCDAVITNSICGHILTLRSRRVWWCVPICSQLKADMGEMSELSTLNVQIWRSYGENWLISVGSGTRKKQNNKWCSTKNIPGTWIWLSRRHKIGESLDDIDHFCDAVYRKVSISSNGSQLMHI